MLKRLFFLVKHNLLLNEIKAHLKHKRESRQPMILPVVDLKSIIKTEDGVKMLETDADDGNVTLEELTTLVSLIVHFKPKTIFEIGTFDGRTTLNMAANAAPDSRIYTLDLPKSMIFETQLRIKSGDRKFIDKQKSGTRFEGTEYEKMITQIYSDSATFDYTPYENSIDFIFIDGSHSYEYVINDTRKALKLLRNGKGIILWHDYGWHEVIKALNEFYLEDIRFKELKNIKNTSLAILISN